MSHTDTANALSTKSGGSPAVVVVFVDASNVASTRQKGGNKPVSVKILQMFCVGCFGDGSNKTLNDTVHLHLLL